MARELEIRTLTDGGQDAAAVLDDIHTLIAGARRSIDIALYDVWLPGEPGEQLVGALQGAARRGVAVRVVTNADGVWNVPVPPPPRLEPELLDALGALHREIPGEPDLMHHKLLVADGERLWCGSANWTLDSLTREENVIVTARSRPLASRFRATVDELWQRRDVARSGRQKPVPVRVGDVTAAAWFCPGHGEQLAQRIAKAVTAAKRRVRIASPVLTNGLVLRALDDKLRREPRFDARGVCDWTQLHAVFGQWRDREGRPSSKIPVLARVLEAAEFTGKRSLAWSREGIHDFMHAKVVVCDDTVFTGSFNLSRSGERNAESVLEIRSPRVAAELAAFVDAVRGRYPDVTPPALAGELTTLGASLER